MDSESLFFLISNYLKLLKLKNVRTMHLQAAGHKSNWIQGVAPSMVAKNPKLRQHATKAVTAKTI